MATLSPEALADETAERALGWAAWPADVLEFIRHVVRRNDDGSAHVPPARVAGKIGKEFGIVVNEKDLEAFCRAPEGLGRKGWWKP